YVILTVRLLPEERAHLEVEAERVGLSLAGHVRTRLMPKSRGGAVRRPPVEYAVLGQLMGQIGKIGGNLHQILKRVNFGEAVGRREIDSAIADWRAIAEQIKAILGGRPGRADGD